MIKNLRIKFVSIIMLIMTVVLVIIFFAVNISMSQLGNQKSLEMMRNILRNDGYIQPPRNKQTNLDNAPMLERPLQNIFIVELTDKDKTIKMIKSDNTTYSNEEIKTLVELALKENKKYGTVLSERFLIDNKNNNKMILFIDNRLEKDIEVRLMWTSFAICSLSLIVIFFVALVSSNWAIKPVKNSFEKQKQFIADASHELKTPLTVISANIDVLKDEIGSNKWLEYIKAETQRMCELTNNLLYLAKNDSDENLYNYKSFNLSEAVMSSTMPFEYVAFESQKKITTNISDDIYTKGDEIRIKQAIIILLDNAIKNTNKNGWIEIGLKVQSNKKIISVSNSGDGIREEDLKKIFERFYRSDSSRTRDNGGYGLGLSIAKAIVEKHNGKIIVESEVGKGAIFSIIL